MNRPAASTPARQVTRHEHVPEPPARPPRERCNRIPRAAEARSQRLHLRTNLDQWVTIDAAHPLSVHAANVPGGPAGPVPYVHMEHGLAARLARPVYYELVELGIDAEHGRLGVWSAGCFFPLEPTEEINA